MTLPRQTAADMLLHVKQARAQSLRAPLLQTDVEQAPAQLLHKGACSTSVCRSEARELAATLTPAAAAPASSARVSHTLPQVTPMQISAGGKQISAG